MISQEQPLEVAASAYDGDTITVEAPDGALRVRILGLDAPERNGPTLLERCAAEVARQRLVDLLDGRAVTLSLDGFDRYGRILARVYVDGKDVADLMVCDGYARPYGGERREPWTEVELLRVMGVAGGGR